MSQYKHFGCTQFRNGNLNLRIEKEDLEEFNQDQVFFVSDLLWHMSCAFIGDDFCLGNSIMAHTIYNYYMDCCYVFLWSDLEILAKGKTVKLHAYRPDENEREIIEKENAV